MDLVNFSAGYSQMKHFSYEENRQESNRKYVHPVLILENADLVFNQSETRLRNENERQFQNLEEHLLMRVFQPI